LSAYKFTAIDNAFKDYVEHFYKEKSTTTDPTQRNISKSYLNNLLGRFGLKLTKTKTAVYSSTEADLILATRTIIFYRELPNKNYLITHSVEINESITNKFDLDYIKVVNKEGEGELTFNNLSDVSVAIASAVTAYARIYMHDIKLQILKSGGNIYYTDTDSIITDKPLPEKLVGDKLGQFKLEHRIKEGYFISNKTYCIVDFNDNVTIKAKGVNPASLNLEDFKALLHGQNVKANKKYSTKNYAEGSVLLENK
jgi:hypothetical protein